MKGVNELIRKIKHFIALTIIAMLFAGNVTNASAATSTATIEPSNRILLSQGYTEEGVHYSVYLNDAKSNSEVRPNGLINKQYTVDLQYEGNIKPPDSIPWEYNEGSIVWSGTLYLKNYYSEYFFGWTTYATYSGLVYAWV